MTEFTQGNCKKIRNWTFKSLLLYKDLERRASNFKKKRGVKKREFENDLNNFVLEENVENRTMSCQILSNKCKTKFPNSKCSPTTIYRIRKSLNFDYKPPRIRQSLKEIQIAKRLPFALDHKSNKTDWTRGVWLYKLDFQQDGASPHTSRKTMDFLNRRCQVMNPWPPNSPDLNHIENLWSIMDRRLKHKEENLHQHIVLEGGLPQLPKDRCEDYLSEHLGEVWSSVIHYQHFKVMNYVMEEKKKKKLFFKGRRTFEHEVAKTGPMFTKLEFSTTWKATEAYNALYNYPIVNDNRIIEVIYSNSSSLLSILPYLTPYNPSGYKAFRGYKLESPESNYSANKDKSIHRGPIGYTPQNSGIGIHYKYPENYHTEGERPSQQSYKKREMSKRNPQRNNRSRTYREENSKENRFQLGKKTQMNPLCGGSSNPRGGTSATPKPDLGDSTLTDELNSEVQRVDSELSVIKGKNHWIKRKKKKKKKRRMKRKKQ
ncbi:transposable element tc3 transposase-like protein [Anaeramoeba flamelloides]|uniref:Transposable element tc3 transposase-like protein n=1 Tax=Anaeramoeba flamelloides TaxID=1746091 RepID=A0AAV7Y3Y9_9EUKA|nr:transposable element tc3 transposase-like protein [Anaeramoeba flamelloides]